MSPRAISVVVPSYFREGVLVDTIRSVQGLLGGTDEIVVVDQTPLHEPETRRAIAELSRSARIRWYRKNRASICEAMNAGALLARNEILLFLDDDVVPSPDLLEVYRELFEAPGAPHAVSGQILQPWHAGPVHEVSDFALGFDFAFSKPAKVVPISTGNFAVRRQVFLAAGGMDETFEGGAHRCDADLGYRLSRFTGQPSRFEPRASVRHLQAGGGTRAHGAKDSWASIGSAVGDHYLGLRWFGWAGAAKHSIWRLLRAPISRYSLRRPWLIPWLGLREVSALLRALILVGRGPARTVGILARYPELEEFGVGSQAEERRAVSASADPSSPGR